MLTEFVVIIPMLIVFFFGILGSGQLIGNLTWISQASYIGAVSGSGMAQTTAADAIRTNLERLRSLQSHGQVDAGANWNVTPAIFAGPVTQKPVIRVDVNANINRLSQAITSSGLGVGVVAPYLVPNVSQFAGLNSFANPAGVGGCSGASCGGTVVVIGKPYLPAAVADLAELVTLEEVRGLVEVPFVVEVAPRPPRE